MTAHEMSQRDDMNESVTQLPQDDWVDQDLLTRRLAGSLLDNEIAAERARIDRHDRGEPVPEALLNRVDMQRRLDAMEAIRDGLYRRDQ